MDNLRSPSPENGSPSAESGLVCSTCNDTNKREYPVGPSLPDIKNGIYSTDEFRMYSFKVRPCTRAYSHDWKDCPFVHPREHARRRDPRKYHYSCIQCPDFRERNCRRGDTCEYAQGVFECGQHPAQYRTRLCKDGTSCNRRVRFFAHTQDELRPLFVSTGSAVPSSPRFYDQSVYSPINTKKTTSYAVQSPRRMSPRSIEPMSSRAVVGSGRSECGSSSEKSDWGVDADEFGKLWRSSSFGNDGDEPDLWAGWSAWMEQMQLGHLLAQKK